MQNMLKSTSRAMLRGFSLIEILIAILLVGLVAGAVAVAMFGQLDSGRKGAARSQAYEIAKALDVYRLQVGHFPTEAEGGLDALTHPPKGEPVMERLPEDPWGNAYVYVYPGTHNKNKPDVISKGPDGLLDTEDDIGNWPEGEK